MTRRCFGTVEAEESQPREAWRVLRGFASTCCGVAVVEYERSQRIECAGCGRVTLVRERQACTGER